MFKALRRQNAEAPPLISELEAEHIEDSRLISDLKHTLVDYERAGQSELAALAQAVETYADFHWNRMRKEEEILLPLAERSLTVED